MPQAHVKTATADHDDAMMRVLVNLEALQKLAAETGDADLATRLQAIFDEHLQRYYDAKRAQLEAVMQGAAPAKTSRRA